MIYASGSMAAVLFLSVLLGALLGLLYDVMRFFRDLLKISPKLSSKRWVKLLCFFSGVAWDIFFFAIAGISVSFFLYYTNDGIFRTSSVVTVIVGFCLYRVTVGRIIYALLKIFRKIIKKIVIFSLKAIAFPIKSVYNIIVRISEHSSLSKNGSIFEISREKGGDRSSEQ